MFDDASGYRSAFQPWGDAVRLQTRVVAALIRRETRARFGEHSLGYLWAIIEPTLHLLLYVLVFTYLLRRHAALGDSLALFMLTGMVPYFLFYKLATYLGGAVDENRALLNLPPVKPIDILISRAILETATFLFVAFILFTSIYMGGTADAIPYRPLRVAAGIAVTCGFGIGLGIMNTIFRAFFRNWMTIFALMLSPVFLLSGIWFLPSAVPPPFRDYLLYNPVMHYIMWVRSGFYRNYDPSELDYGYAVGWSVVTLMLGLAVLRVGRRKLMEPV
jgi:capsular polysaccharide transport system permease protein